jgi:aminoglycoside phosphotransferase family enzyme/predicted kinase
MGCSTVVGTVENVAKEVRQFLADPASYTPKAHAVDIHETHGALVFLAGKDAWKIKKPVTFPYMDFSTLEKRREICLREYLLNKPAASELYLGIVPITREPGGKLVFDGEGEVVEWALHMRRFAQSCLLDKIVARGEGTNALFDALARVISAYHTAAPQSAKLDHEHMMRSIIDELSDAFSLHKNSLSGLDPHAFEMRARQQLAEAGYYLRMRAERGLVRRCHGDLHLTNILIQNGEPILFDGLEFSEELATTDILYDLAFVLMDLDQRGERGFANYLLNRYLHVANDPANLYGLKALPLFLACRAAILAMVALDRLDQLKPKETDAIARTTGDARRYFKGAISYLQPTKPRLIAVGGFSGTGKSTIAASISGIVDSIIGGVHIRSDVERKAMFDVSETTRLAPEHYTEDVTERVYDVLFQKARIALKAGHTVVVDAVFSCGLRRAQIERVAQDLNLEFVGIWLTAPEDVLTARISGRQGDASDATPDVVRRQFTQGTGPISWNLVDAGATREDVIKQACKMCR